MKRLKKILFVFGVLIIVLLIVFFIPESKKRIKTVHFIFHYSSNIENGKITLLADALDGNYKRLGNDLKTSPYANIEVNIYSQRWRYIKATKNWGASGNIEGISKLHFGEPSSWKKLRKRFNTNIM